MKQGYETGKWSIAFFHSTIGKHAMKYPWTLPTFIGSSYEKAMKRIWIVIRFPCNLHRILVCFVLLRSIILLFLCVLQLSLDNKLKKALCESTWQYIARNPCWKSGIPCKNPCLQVMHVNVNNVIFYHI